MSSATPERRFRGYIASRPVRGLRVPQRLQNLLVRDYAGRHGYQFLLSATEYVMPSCYMVLQSVLDELHGVDGIIAFSIFMLPERPARRREIFSRILGAGAQFHAALENISVCNEQDVARCEDLLAVAAALPQAPFAASMERVLSGAPEEVSLERLLLG